MSDPVRADQTLWLGDKGAAIVWGFGPADAPVDLTGSQFTLRIKWRLGEIVATTESGALSVDLTKGEVTWTPPFDTLIPRGYGTGYELRRRIGGTDLVWAFGDMTAKSGFRV